jgi:hypothetical protein
MVLVGKLENWAAAEYFYVTEDAAFYVLCVEGKYSRCLETLLKELGYN